MKIEKTRCGRIKEIIANYFCLLKLADRIIFGKKISINILVKVHIKSEGVLKMAMNPYQLADQGYLELNDTYICKDYGFASVMRWLGTWHASKGSATDKVIPMILVIYRLNVISSA